MELSSPEAIRALMQVHGSLTRPGRRRGAQGVARRASKAPRIGCHCGQCRQCLDNARWERIFAEKFADPNYYTHLNTRNASPLTSL
jgi:hypothetical protein